MRALVVSAFVICMAGLYSFEYRQRLADGIGTDHKTVSNAVANRQAFTKSLMDCLQIDNDSHGRIKIAVTEVQVRYYLDDSSPFVVLSLDGRTSPNFARYVDRKTGIRYFDKFLRECKPDFIELGQFDKGEPILYELTKRFEETSDAVIEKGFVFKPTKCRSIVRYLGEISPNHS
jgi:hypothetical protein